MRTGEVRDREADIIDAFVSVTRELVRGHDVVDLLARLSTTCADLLDVASVGLLLADGAGDLHVLAASSEATRQLEVLQLQADDGPCLDCFKTGEPVHQPDLAAVRDRWPAFVPAALDIGVRSAHVVPLRLDDRVLGAMGLFGSATGRLADRDLALARALADVATVALVNDREFRDRVRTVGQLERALTSRVHIEQAKGLLAQQAGTDVEEAFVALRHYARDHGLRLGDVAQDVVARAVPAERVLDHHLTRASQR